VHACTPGPASSTSWLICRSRQARRASRNSSTGTANSDGSSWQRHEGMLGRLKRMAFSCSDEISHVPDGLPVLQAPHLVKSSRTHGGRGEYTMSVPSLAVRRATKGTAT
jgi:hypothetical protein